MNFKTSIFHLSLMPLLPIGVSRGWLPLRGSRVERGVLQLLPLLRRLPTGVKVRPPTGAALRGGVA